MARRGTQEAADVGRLAPRLLLLLRLDSLITRVFYCPQPWAVPSIRLVDPSATFLPDWPTFAAAFPEADVGVVLCGPSGGDDLAARLSELTHRHRLPSVVVVVTHLYAEHLLPFRRIAVDEFVPLASMATDLPEALPLRGTGVSLRRICEALDLDLRSLQRACRRHLESSLGRVSAADAAAELLRLRRRILKHFGSSGAGGRVPRVRGSPLTAALSPGGRGATA